MLIAVAGLQERGVKILDPQSVFVGLEVDPDAIAPGVLIYPGCRLLGGHLSIGPGCVIGNEGPATVDGCQLDVGVTLSGGFFKDSVFLAGASMGSGAHVRAGCLLEELSGGAHTVGLKQTVFMPFVTAGSLINFCDALMAGGTSRKDHSEIGSSYVHFNFTPHGDKATPSLLGDVPRGVMLNQPPIFLGGQGGLVGPTQIAYGTVLAAGCVNRRDITEAGRLILAPASDVGIDRAYDLSIYKDIARRVTRNLEYIAHLTALVEWYRWVRGVFVGEDRFRRACFEGALRVLDLIIAEREQRLTQLAQKAEQSLAVLNSQAVPVSPRVLEEHQYFIGKWPVVSKALKSLDGSKLGVENREIFIAALEKVPHVDYIQSIKNLPPDVVGTGSAWLQTIVDHISMLWVQTEV